jgi:hypothetical protein
VKNVAPIAIANGIFFPAFYTLQKPGKTSVCMSNEMCFAIRAFGSPHLILQSITPPSGYLATACVQNITQQPECRLATARAPCLSEQSRHLITLLHNVLTH